MIVEQIIWLVSKSTENIRKINAEIAWVGKSIGTYNLY